jgi:hypothetical protein
MYETISEFLRRQPFEPFEVRLSNGESYEVRHPEMALLLKSKIIIGLPDEDRFAVCSLLHITSVRGLQAA